MPLFAFGIILCAQVATVSSQNRRCRVLDVLPLAYHSDMNNGTMSWPQNIKNALANTLTTTLRVSELKRSFCRQGQRYCRRGFHSSCCRNPLYPNSNDLVKLFNNQYFCRDLYSDARSATRCITGVRSSSSVSPWVISVNYNRLRYPSEIWEAKCTCSGSCSNLGVGNMDYHHQPIMSKMLVGIRDYEEGPARFEIQEFAVGCTCAVS